MPNATNNAHLKRILKIFHVGGLTLHTFFNGKNCSDNYGRYINETDQFIHIKRSQCEGQVGGASECLKYLSGYCMDLHPIAGARWLLTSHTTALLSILSVNLHWWTKSLKLSYSVHSVPLYRHCVEFIKQEVKVIWQKAPHGGPIPRLWVTPGGQKLYHWIPGVGFPISVP